MKIPTVFITDVTGNRGEVVNEALTNAMRALVAPHKNENKTPSGNGNKCTLYMFLPDLLLALSLAETGVNAFPISVCEFRGGELEDETPRNNDPPYPGGS